MTEQVQKRKRGGGRAGNALRRGSASIDQMPWHLPINTDKPTEPLDEAVSYTHLTLPTM